MPVPPTRSCDEVWIALYARSIRCHTVVRVTTTPVETLIRMRRRHDDYKTLMIMGPIPGTDQLQADDAARKLAANWGSFRRTRGAQARVVNAHVLSQSLNLPLYIRSRHGMVLV